MTAPRTDPVEENEVDRRKRIRYNLQVVLKDASPEERKAYVDSEMVQAPKPEQGMGGAFRSIGQGVSFNFSDEAEAGLRSLLPGRTYGGEKAKVEQSLSDFRTTDPKKALALELGGGLLTGGAIAKGATKGFKGLKSLAALSGSGAASGAVAGAGAAEGGVGDRLKGGALGGVLGAGLGAVASRVPGAVSSLANKASRTGTAVANKGLAAAGLTPIAQSADQVAPEVEAIAKRLSTRGVDPAEISANAADMASVPEARLFDATGREGQRHVRGMRALGGPASRTIDEALDTGHATQRNAIESTMTGGGGRTNRVQLLDELTARQKANAAPLYQAAFADASAIDDEVVAEILSRPDMQKMIDQYAKLEAIAGRKAPKVYEAAGEVIDPNITFNPPETKARFAPTLEGLDFAKKTMDAEIDNAFSSQFPKDNARGFALSTARGQLLSRLDELGASGNKGAAKYKEARQVWGGDEASKTAVADGGAMMRKGGRFKDTDAIAPRVAEMSPAELELAQASAAREIGMHLNSASDNADLTKRLANDDFRERVTALWGDKAPGMLNQLDKIRNKADIRAFIQGNSQTADKLADAADAAGENFVDNVVGGGGWTGAAMKFGRDKLARPVMAKFGADDRAAQAGFYSQPITNEKALQDLVREMQRQRSLKTPSAVARGVGGRIAGSSVNR